MRVSTIGNFLTGLTAMQRLQTALDTTQRQISSALGTAVGATVVTAVLAGLAEDAPAIERLPAHQWAFFTIGLLMLPGALLAWRVRDEDVAATRRPG